MTADSQGLDLAGSALRIWDAKTGRELLTLRGHRYGAGKVSYSPDGRRILSCGDYATVKVWDAANGEELLTFPDTVAVSSAVFAPDGRQVAAVGYDLVSVWATASEEEVKAWQKEEQAAARYLDDQRRQFEARKRAEERSYRPGCQVEKWLTLPPIQLGAGHSPVEALDAEQFEGERRIRPRAGEGVAVGPGTLEFREATGLLVYPGTNCVGYALCYLQSKTNCHGVKLHVGCDHPARVYLNGEQVHRKDASAGRRFDGLAEGLNLKAGINVLVFKVFKDIKGMPSSLRLTDADDNPVEGVTVTLDPDEDTAPATPKP